MPGPGTIIVDHREHAPIVCKELADRFGYVLTRAQLELGDMQLPGRTVVERKTTDDFCLSVMDGRLFRQAYRLANAAVDAVLLVEGDTFRARTYRLSMESLRGALITLAQTFRLPMLRTVDERDTAWHLHHLAEQRRRIGRKRGPLTGTAPRRLRSQKRFLLQGLPGIGPALADALLNTFGSVSDIAAATPEEIAATPGIGNKRAQTIFDVLHEDPGRYKISRA